MSDNYEDISAEREQIKALLKHPMPSRYRTALERELGEVRLKIRNNIKTKNAGKQYDASRKEY